MSAERKCLSGVQPPLFSIRSVDTLATPIGVDSFFVHRKGISFFTTASGTFPKVLAFYGSNKPREFKIPLGDPKDRIAMCVPLSGMSASMLLVVMRQGGMYTLNYQTALKHLSTNPAVQRSAVLWVIAGNSSHLFYQAMNTNRIHVHNIQANGEDRDLCSWRNPVSSNELVTGFASLRLNGKNLLVVAGGGSIYTTEYEGEPDGKSKFEDVTKRIVNQYKVVREPSLLVSNDQYLVWITLDVVYVIPLTETFPEPCLRVNMKKIEGILKIEAPGLSITSHKMKPFLTRKHLVMFSERHYVAISLETGKVAFFHTFPDDDLAVCVSPPARPEECFHVCTSKILEIVSCENATSVTPLHKLNKMFIDGIREGKDIDGIAPQASSKKLCDVNYILLKLIQEGDYASAIQFLLADSQGTFRVDPDEVRILEILISELQVLDVFRNPSPQEGQRPSQDAHLGLLEHIITSLRFRALSGKSMDSFSIFRDAAQLSEETGRNGIAYIAQLVQMGQFNKALCFISKYFDYYEYLLPAIAAKNPHEYVAAVKELDGRRGRLLRVALPFVKGYIGCEQLLNLVASDSSNESVFDWLWAFCFEPAAVTYEERMCEQLRKRFEFGSQVLEGCGDRLWFLMNPLKEKKLNAIVNFLASKPSEEEVTQVSQPSSTNMEIADEINSIVQEIGQLTKGAKAAADAWLRDASPVKRPETVSTPIIPDKNWECSVCRRHFLRGTNCIEMFCGHRFHEGCLQREMFQLLPQEDRTREKVLEDCPLCGVISTRKILAPIPPLFA